MYNKLCKHVMALLFLTVSVSQEFKKGWWAGRLWGGVSHVVSYMGAGLESSEGFFTHTSSTWAGKTQQPGRWGGTRVGGAPGSLSYL